MLQDGTNTYVYGLDLISATDGAGVQTYFLYDGLGSVTDLTDDEGDVVDGFKRENERLKQLVAELSLEVLVLKKEAVPEFD